MKKLSVYDPPQCCSTGVCGPDADDTLVQFAAALDHLKRQGVEVARFDLGHNPGAFVQNRTVKDTLDREGMSCLPLVIVDDQILTRGGYPTRNALEQMLDAPSRAEPAPKAQSRCCGAGTQA